jgi:hypothetical protein
MKDIEIVGYSNYIKSNGAGFFEMLQKLEKYT